MNKVKSIICIAMAAVVFDAPALAQATEAPTQKERTEAFLAARDQQQGVRAKKLGNASSGLQQLNGLVRAVNLRLPAPTFVDDPDQKRRLADAFLIDVAQELAMLGITPGDVRAANGIGQQLVEAAAARVRGVATLRQNSLLADSVSVAKVTAVNSNDDRGDGYLTTVTLSVVRPFSKSVAEGDVIELRRLSGQSATKKVESSIEEALDVGDQILVLGSSTFYRNASGKSTKATKVAVELSPFYHVNGNALAPSSPYQTPADLSEVTNSKGAL